MENTNFPIRINHYLALKMVASRRAADRLIAQKRVKVNGRMAKVGEQINAADKVEIDNKPVEKKSQKKQYVLFYKPKGIATTPTKNLTSIREISPYGDKLYPVGRLDRNSQGLILLTNDGRVTDALLNPKYEHEKEYIVQVNKNITPRFIEKLQAGVNIGGGYTTKQAQAAKISTNTFRITLTEGKRRQIRRMCDALGYDVRDLKRTRIMHLELGNLKPGETRELKNAELDQLKKELRLL